MQVNGILFLMIFTDFFAGALSFLSADEVEISLDVALKLQVHRCIIFQNENDEMDISHIKKFSSNKFFVRLVTNIKDYTDLVEKEIWNYGKEKEMPSYKEMFVLKDETLPVLLSTKIMRIPGAALSLKVVNWLVFSNYLLSPSDIVSGYYSDPLIGYDWEFINVVRINSTYHKLTEMYVIKNTSFYVDLGIWDSQDRLTVTNVSFYLRRLDFNGTKLRATLPMICKNETTFDSKVFSVTEIVRDISNLMNFKIIERVSSDSRIYWDFYKHSDDILLGGFMSYHVLWAYQGPFLGPLYNIKYNWYVKHPIENFTLAYYLQPVERYFWIALISTIILGTILIMIINIYLNFNEEGNIFVKNLFTGTDMFCSNRSYGYSADALSIRVVSISIRVIATISILTYGAFIMSYLTFKVPKVPFSTLKEFLGLKEYRLMITQDVVNSVLDIMARDLKYHPPKRISIHFDALSGRDFESVENFKILRDNFSILTDSYNFLDVRKVCDDEKLAMAAFNNEIHDLRPPCYLHEINRVLFEATIYVLLGKKYDNGAVSLEKVFQDILIRFNEFGILKRLQNKIQGPDTKPKPELSFRHLQLERIIEVFKIPLHGIAVSVVIFVIELMLKAWMFYFSHFYLNRHN